MGVENLATFLNSNQNENITVNSRDISKYFSDMQDLTPDQKNNIYDYIGFLGKNGITEEEHKAILEAMNSYKNNKTQETKNNIENLKDDIINDNYIKELYEVGLNGEAKDIGILLIKNLDISINDLNQESILKRLSIIVIFIIEMETDGKNTANKKSSAKGYFQYLNGNGGDKLKGKYSSFESALRRAYIFYTGSINVPIKEFTSNKIPDWLKIAYNTPSYDPRKLTAEQQIILFLIDIFYKPGTSKHLKNILENGNMWSLRRLYEDSHHTSNNRETTPETENRLDKYIGIYQSKFESINNTNYAEI